MVIGYFVLFVCQKWDSESYSFTLMLDIIIHIGENIIFRESNFIFDFLLHELLFTL